LPARFTVPLRFQAAKQIGLKLAAMVQVAFEFAKYARSLRQPTFCRERCSEHTENQINRQSLDVNIGEMTVELAEFAGMHEAIGMAVNFVERVVSAALRFKSKRALKKWRFLGRGRDANDFNAHVDSFRQSDTAIRNNDAVDYAAGTRHGCFPM
jgi:hypothetical protein